MSNKKKTVVMEKGGVETEVTREAFKGLAKRGWKVKDDGTKEQTKAVEDAHKEAEKLEQQELKLFGIENEEN